MKRALLILALLGVVSSGVPQPAQIILFRHGEKPADPNAADLSPEGRHRARELVPFITTEPAFTKYGSPAALYATQRTKHGHSARTQETLAPLSRELHLPIQTPCAAEQYQRLASAILANSKYQGKTVVICWVHDYIRELAYALGVRPELPRWKGEDYDTVYVISYEGGKASLRVLRQNFSPKTAAHTKHEK